MTGSTYQKALVLLWGVLAAGLVVELATGAWHGTWDLEPLLPAVLTSGIYQIVMSTRTPGERRSVPAPALVLVVITATLAVISSVVAWMSGDVGQRTGAVVAASAALFFLGGIVTLQVRAVVAVHSQRSR